MLRARRALLLVCVALLPFAAPLGFFADDELTQAFECALLDSQELMHNYLEKSRAPLVPIEDCFMNPTAFKYPNLTVTLALQNFHVAIHPDDPFVDVVKTVINYAAKRLYNKYKYEYNGTIFHYESDMESMTSNLKQGLYDVIYPGINSEFSNITSKFTSLRRGCSMLGFDLRIMMAEDKNAVGSLSALLAKSKLNPGMKVIVAHQAEGEILKQRYGIEYQLVGGTEEQRRAEYKNATDKFFGVLTHEPLYKKVPGFFTLSLNYQIPIPLYFRQESNYDFVDTVPLPHEVGNVKLLSIFNAALYEEQKNASAYDWDDEKLSLVGDCLFLHPTYPEQKTLYSYTNEEGHSTHNFLLEVFQNGRPLKLGYVYEVSPPLMEAKWETESNKDEMMLADEKSGKRVVGKLPDLEKRLLRRISEHYHLAKPIKVQQVLFNTSNEVFAALERGDIDTTSLTFSLGSMYNYKPRRWQFLYSCTGLSYRLSFFVNKKLADGITNFDEMVEMLATTKKKMHILVGTDRLQAIVLELLYDALFARRNYETFNFTVVTDTKQAFEYLTKGEYEGVPVFAYLPRYLGSVPGEYKENVVVIPAKQSIPVGMFFRRDKRNPPLEEGAQDAKVDTSVVVFIAIISVMAIFISIAVAFTQRPTSLHLPQYESETTSEVVIDNRPPLFSRRGKKSTNVHKEQ